METTLPSMLSEVSTLRLRLTSAARLRTRGWLRDGAAALRAPQCGRSYGMVTTVREWCASRVSRSLSRVLPRTWCAVEHGSIGTSGHSENLNHDRRLMRCAPFCSTIGIRYPRSWGILLRMAPSTMSSEPSMTLPRVCSGSAAHPSNSHRVRSTYARCSRQRSTWSIALVSSAAAAGTAKHCLMPTVGPVRPR